MGSYEMVNLVTSMFTKEITISLAFGLGNGNF